VYLTVAKKKTPSTKDGSKLPSSTLRIVQKLKNEEILHSSKSDLSVEEVIVKQKWWSTSPLAPQVWKSLLGLLLALDRES